jgi:hypothetical protein
MTGTRATDPCAGEGTCLIPPAEFVRLRYFFGQRLGVVDLADEQSYVVGKQRFHNLRLHGVGVLCGLRAMRYVYPQGSAETTPTTLLRVRRGAALDACGREIVVGCDQCIDVAAWYAQHPAARPLPQRDAILPSTLRLWAVLFYRECPSDPAPAPRDPCGCDAGGCEFARIREGFELRLLTDAEAKLLAPKSVGLMGEDDVPEEILKGSIDDELERMLARKGGAPCPEPPTDPCLLLASFEAKLDSGATTVLDIAKVDNAIPERLTVLPTSVLQERLLHALAAVSDSELTGSGPRFSAVTFMNGGTDSGTLSIEIHTDGTPLSRDPFAAPASLAVSVFRFNKASDGSWSAATPSTATFVPGPPPQIQLQWASGGGLADGGQYRLLIESQRANPPVDTKMRPLTPLSWARHFRLIADKTSGNLVLADTLFPK